MTLLALLPAGWLRAETVPPVSFRNEVIPVLSKAGCSLGTCHGNKYGKGGFKISLRNQEPEFDLAALTRDAAGRRINPIEPERSLILEKAVTQVPHEGGARFSKDSEEYQVLVRWIAEGCRDDAAAAPKLVRLDVSPVEQVLTEPNREVALRAEAHFADGTRRDVTTRAVYEPANNLVKVSHDGLVRSEGPGESTVLVRFLDRQVPVRLAFIPARPGLRWNGPRPNNEIDRQVFHRLRLGQSSGIQ